MHLNSHAVFLSFPTRVFVSFYTPAKSIYCPSCIFVPSITIRDMMTNEVVNVACPVV